MEKSFKEVNRKIQSMSAALALIESELRDFIPDALARTSAKVIAKQLSATERAARNWKQRQNLPGGAYLIMLGRAYPAIGAKLIELLNAEMGDTGRQPAEVLNEIQKLLEARK